MGSIFLSWSTRSVLTFSPLSHWNAIQAHENSFIGLDSRMQHLIMVEYLHECSPNPCNCYDTPCTYPAVPYTAPPSMRINLPFYRDLSTTQMVRLHGAWRCSHSFLTDLYPISDPISEQQVAAYLYHGLRESVYSANMEAVWSSSSSPVVNFSSCMSQGQCHHPQCSLCTLQGILFPLISS